MAKKDDSRDWKKAAEQCLVTALRKAEESLQCDAIEKLKATESVIKTVGDIVGAGQYLARVQRTGTGGGGGGDDDD
jgi:hypothetical protein